MKRRRRKKYGFIRRSIIIILIIGFFSSGLIVLWAATLPIPDLGSFEKRKVEQSTKIYDRTGEILLFDLHENIQRTIVPLEEMSRNVKNATVAIEDAEFYKHNGIRPLRTLKAIFDNIMSGNLLGGQGGSTITQQVVKNSVLVSDKKISRKIKEWVLALKLEQIYSKEKILELYLNEAPYGGSMYGVEEASRAFFGKSSLELSIAEAAYLAALPQAPTYYSPYGNHMDKLNERKNLVLAKMFENNFITEEEYEKAKNEEVLFQPQQDVGIKAPHFVFFIREYLESMYGKRAVEEHGFRVITTLDYNLQKKAEEIVQRRALENVEKFNATNAALVAIDPRTGQILAMVGSRNYFDEEIDGNFNVVVAPNRQPGSAFKPFVYAAAFKKGYTPETVVFDLKTQFSTLCEPDNLTSEGECYSPSNYDNIFRGPVTFREGLAQSINIPSIKVLYLAGLGNALRLAQGMGITSLTDINRYGLTLVLGGGEVSLLDMTSAYGAFANEGIRNPYTGILKIEDNKGVAIDEFKQRENKVLDEQIALLISDILSDNAARAPAFGHDSYLHFPGRDVAVKTGTTNEYRDAWIIGYTPNIAVGAWAGNNDNSPMEKKVAGFIIAPLWNEFMREALVIRPEEHFKKPASTEQKDLKPVMKGFWQGGESYVIDTITGKLATKYTPEELEEEKVVRNVHTILYWINKNDPLEEAPEYPARDPQFSLWEYGVALWKDRMGIEDETVDVIPTEYDNVHKPEFAPKLTITNPTEGKRYSEGERITIVIQSTGKFPLSNADFFVNGVLIGSAKRPPFSFSFTPDEIENITKNNTLTVVGYDSVRNHGSSNVLFEVVF